MTTLEPRDTEAEITFEQEEQRCYVHARFRAAGKTCDVFERIPLHVMQKPKDEREWHFDQIMKGLHHRVQRRRLVEESNARGA